MTSLCLFILVILFAPSSYSQDDDDMFYNSCSKPFDCGRVRNLSYPFWRDRRLPACGLEGFYLECRDGEDPVITIDNHDFSVMSLNQSVNEMAIVRRYGLKPDLCPDETTTTTKFTNITLDASSFSLVPDFYTKFSNISLFYNCTDLQNTTSFPCKVDGEKRDAFYGYDGLQGGWMDDRSKCTIKLEIPVPKTALQGRQLGFDDLIMVSEQGFNVSYNYNQDTCNSCRESGGICGTSTTNSNMGFTCVCSDHSDPVSCSNKPGSSGGISTTIIVAIVAPISVSVLLFLLGCIFFRRRAKKKSNIVLGDPTNTGAIEITTVESLQVNLNTLQVATNNFSEHNKLGQGGFGAVYKGLLPNGQEIAVKKLSRGSSQGSLEFKNEVLLLAKLQHRNLVRLLGFCLEGEEKILVYEYVPNKSLDFFLFDEGQRGQLHWSRRYKIVGGIARGILYLHEDSRLRIIHRDLKASNILLDSDMNTKISDFGMAKMFVVDQTQGNTSRIVGTYGYMSPEYAMHGQFSVKSDMYSFGVLVLEIICGKKNSSFCQTDGAYDLVSYVWKHWREGTPMEVLDPILEESYSRNEVIRCIQIGLLCVQEDPSDRPTMATVVLMLNSYSVTLQMPKQPGFLLHSRSEKNFPVEGLDSDTHSTAKSVSCSVDEASITGVYPR